MQDLDLQHPFCLHHHSASIDKDSHPMPCPSTSSRTLTHSSEIFRWNNKRINSIKEDSPHRNWED